MKIVIASKSELKVSATKEAYGEDGNEFIALSTNSAVPEQPFGTMAMRGALNRINDAQKQVPDADCWVSIESGIEEKNGKFYDIACVVIQHKQWGTHIAYTAPVEFPAVAVEEARKRGFDQWTAGKVMAEMNLVAKHDDPHLSLTGKSRKDYIVDAIKEILSRPKREPGHALDIPGMPFSPA